MQCTKVQRIKVLGSIHGEGKSAFKIWLSPLIDTKRIRFAAPPTDTRRWQRPEAPAIDRNATIQADRYGPVCYQSPFSGAPAFPSVTVETSEDCLFLNVQSPANASNLPVLVWIHGGGYGGGNGQTDFTDLITVNNNRFVVVTIQYRLGAFGFLASDELVRKGVANAGLLDQNFALQWVQVRVNLHAGPRWIHE